MFKRSTKITSLLVAAASVASTMTPVMAADVKRIESEDGKVYEAVAFKDGKAVVCGELKDEDSAFYYSNGKFEQINEFDSGANLEVYGEKFVKADDGDYFVDLTNGKVSDEEVDEDDKDSAASALRSKIKKVDRYGKNSETPELTKIDGNKFGESWYYTNDYKLDATTTSSQVFTNKDGKYVDADYNLGKIKVKVTAAAAEDKVVSDIIDVENTKDTAKAKKNGVTLKVDAKILDKKVLGQDKDSVYRLATIEFSATATDEHNKVIPAKISEIFGNEKIADNSSEVKIDVIQKISKAQASDEVNDAKYAKSVDNYVLANEDGIENNDISDLKKLLYDGDFTVASGKLVAYDVDDNNSSTEKALSIQSFALKQKSGLYYIKAEGKKEFDVEYCKDLGRHAVDVDVDGNVWFVDGGNIKKFDNKDDADKVYKVDGSMNALSVYDKDNILVWSTDDEVYSVIGKKVEEEKPVEETPAVVAGWNQAADGTWTYVNADGTTVKGWFQSPASGKWFYMDPATGVMQTGWVQSPASGKWFYMNPSNGDMMTGWVQVGTTWYYLNPSNGDMQTGWINDGNAWYYCDASGAMLSNTTVDGYVLGANGAWIR
ncbi:N-acetylmuramoyl-L-alanine amidase family protein [Clostridium sp. SM-530-WT-3G]|uniref:N-acetylmuramoyl-L-alanine amidase family protein n=1 Tax=Clostridium sp. SM-530-WT-3G TaxID=2725303 RepID=UPI00145E1A46|nr:N-acetylmuramoyl-L-alanine amidase family protein [Clostridium sp. SM-530-WT-3G]NME83760.1 N-acetylmuramoyl-L-alanine amidase family protein [Clostridium sp. SM-530-WT-3G]